jgi:prepilin-type N-terminal cleavage/methylation domain-containing protein
VRRPPNFQLFARPTAARRAFTLVELLIVVGVLAILAGGAYVTMRNVREASRDQKLEADVAAVNRALDIYEVSGGGGLPDVASTDVQINTVIDKLKTVSSQRMPGLAGQMIDQRLEVDEMQTSGEAGGSGVRALWNGTTHRFVVANAGAAGVKSFRLNDALGARDYSSEARTPTLQVAQVTTSHWIWDYTDRAASVGGGGGGTVPTSSGGSSSSPPAALTASQLAPPTLSQGTGSYSLIAFSTLTITLSNPNPSGVSYLVYYKNGASGSPQYYKPGTNIPVAPGDILTARAISTDSTRWTNSDTANGVYSVIPVQLKIELTSPATQLSYQQAGGAMDSIATATAPSATLRVTNPNTEIPASYLTSSNFDLLWTKDGSDPLTSATATTATFSAGSPTVSISLAVGQWPATGSLQLKAAARVRAAAVAYLQTSDPQSASVARLLTDLPAPSIDPPSSYRSMDLPISIYKGSGTLPASYRIYYTTNGADPGNSGGNPATGALYSSPFQLGSSVSAAIVRARTYASATYAAWFNPSPLSTSTYTSAGGGNNIVGAFVSDASINGTFVGSLVLSNPHNFNFNSGAIISKGNLYVVGTPSITYNGGTIQGRQFLTDGTEVLPATDTRTVVDLNGSVEPSNYKIILNNGSTIAGKIYRRSTTFAMPTVDAPPSPNNNNNLNVNSPLSGPVSATQYANVNLNNGAGTVTLSPGNFGNISAGSGTTIRIGVAGSTTPTVYNFQGLTLNSNSKLEVLGPVVLTIDRNVNINSGVVMGNSDHPDWLSLNIHSGNFQINSDAAAYAMVIAPSSNVNLNGTFRGGVIANYLTINGNGVAMTLPVQ